MGGGLTQPYASAADVPVTSGLGLSIREQIKTSASGSGVLVPKLWTISIYIDDGRVFEYDAKSAAAAREHASAIVSTGYRSVQPENPNILTHYPPHRITKVKITAPDPIQTDYFDRVRGT